MDKNREEDLKIIKILFLIGAIFSILAGIKHLTNTRYVLYINQLLMYPSFSNISRYIFKFAYILFGILEIAGGIFLIKYRNLNFENLRIKSNEILVWGIFLLFTNFIGGIFALIAYYFLIREKEEKQKENFLKNNIDEIERAFNLKEKGVISEREYENIKKRILDI